MKCKEALKGHRYFGGMGVEVGENLSLSFYKWKLKVETLEVCSLENGSRSCKIGSLFLKIYIFFYNFTSLPSHEQVSST